MLMGVVFSTRGEGETEGGGAPLGSCVADETGGCSTRELSVLPRLAGRGATVTVLGMVFWIGREL